MSNLRWSLVTAIAPILFGSIYWVTHNFLPAGSPLWGSALRALPAGIVLLLIVRRLPQGAWWWRAAMLGSLNMGLFFSLIYVAAQLLPSSIAASISSLSPLVIAGLAWVLTGERITPWFLGGAVLGVIGVALIVGTASGTVDSWGVLASAGAIVLMSIGAVLSKYWDDGTPVLATTAWQLLAGGLELAVAAALVEGAPPTINGSEMAAFAYISLIATALGFVCWFTGLRHLKAGKVAMLGLLNPVTGVLLGVFLASEALTATQTLGIALVLASIVLSQRRKGTKPLHSPPGTGRADSSPALSHR